MDVDLMNSSSSSPQNHLEMMELMMMQLKPAAAASQLFSRHYQDFSAAESSDVEFSGGSATSIETPLTMYHNNPYLNTSPFMGNPIQESTFFTNIPGDSYNNSMQKKMNSMEAMREMIFRIAMMQPIQIDPETVKPPKRKNVKISRDPQSVAARHRRERISEKIRILQRLVPGGTKMDTASMLDEAVHYVKFLKKQVQSLEDQANNGSNMSSRPIMFAGFPTTTTTMSLSSSSSLAAAAATNYSGMVKACQPAAHMVGSMQMLS